MRHVLYASICLVWGSTWLAIKIGLDGVPPFLGAGLRFLLASAILLAILLARGGRLRLTREDRICVLSCGLLSFTLSYACVYWAEQHIPSGLTAIFFSTMPLWVAVLSHFWTKTEILTNRKLTGILIGIAGSAILFWPHEAVSWTQSAAMACALAASAAAGTNTAIVKKYSKHTDVYALNAYGMGIGAICLLGLSVGTEGLGPPAWSTANVLALFYLSIFGSIFAFMVFYSLIKVMDATRLSLITLIFPVVAVVLGGAFQNERITPAALVGIVTVLTGVAITILAPSPARAKDLNRS